MGSDPEALARLIARTYRWDARVAMGLLALFGRPIFDFLVAEEEGRLVGTALLTFGPRAGHLSTVSVDPAYRRRGFARALLEKAHARIRATRRAFATLEVLEGNGPARALYDALGYRIVRRTEVLCREPGNAPAPPWPSMTGTLRRFRRSDGEALAELANALAPAEFARAVPATPEGFRASGLLSAAVGSESAAWTLLTEGRPSGFVRATVGGITRASHLSHPLTHPSVPGGDRGALLSTALEWIGERSRERVITPVPEEDSEARLALAAVGFEPTYRSEVRLADIGR